MFPDDAAAERWFAEGRWPDGPRCPHCHQAESVKRRTHPSMRYHCSKCRQFFSVKVGTVMENSKIGLQKWAFAVYLMATNLKGTSSMHLHRDLGITQKSAWFMAMRIRACWEQGRSLYDGPVEVDEAFFGGREKNKHASKRLGPEWRTGKTAVAAARDQSTGQIAAKVIPDTTAWVLLTFVEETADPEEAEVFTDDNSSYRQVRHHRTVRHSVGEYVNEQAHINGVESFWSMLKRGYYGTHHRMSPAHLRRYVDEFAVRHNQRDADTEVQMLGMVLGMVGKRLRYRDVAVGDGRRQ